MLPEAQFLCGKQSFLSVTIESGVRKGLVSFVSKDAVSVKWVGTHS